MEIETYWLNKIQVILRDSKDRVLTYDERDEIKHCLSRLMLTRYGLTQLWLPGLIEECQVKAREFNAWEDKNSVI